jgi:hypothetical protein
MTKQSDIKIIVIGGTGETGKRIVQHLTHLYPKITLGCAARRLQEVDVSAKNVIAVQLDVTKESAAEAILTNYQLAIIALGPMDKYKAVVHKLCMQANLDVVDINDSIEAADEILALHQTAKNKGLRVFTGMGFTPGVSTLLLMQLADNHVSASEHYHCRTYMGAAYGGGETSPYAIISSFKNSITALINGKREQKSTPWKDFHSQFHFPAQEKPLALIPFATPEISGLLSPLGSDKSRVSTLDSRYHIQFLSKGLAKFLAKLNLNQKKKDYFAKQFYRGGQSMKQKKNADPDTTLWVYPDGSPEQGLLIHGIISSYDLTALMACSVTDAWLNGVLADYQGVYATEHLHENTRQYLLTNLQKWGVTSRIATAENQLLADIHFGWSDTPCYDYQKLRNYGKNWYTVKNTHPRMAGLQKRFLFESTIWASLKNQQSWFKFSKFVVKTMIGWKNHNKQLASYRLSNKDYGQPEWIAITKDMSMFTSGYSCAREVLGEDVAYKSYKSMFLETGKMEMRWLWPKPESFILFNNPEKSIIDYWSAFMLNYEKLGLFKLSIEKTDTQLSCSISQCAYAKMFIQLGCPELADMVREMEREALEFMSSQCDLHVNWVSGSQGCAAITLQIKSEIEISAKAG